MSNLKIQDLRDYVKMKSRSKFTQGYPTPIDGNKIKKIDKMNFEELKFFYDTELRQIEDLDEHVLRETEKDLIDQMNELKIEKAKAMEEKKEMHD